MSIKQFFIIWLILGSIMYLLTGHFIQFIFMAVGVGIITLSYRLVKGKGNRDNRG